MIKDTRRLFNILTRHSIYVEAVKSSQDNLIGLYQESLKIALKEIINDVPYSTMDGLTKVELNTLIRKLNKAQDEIYLQYTEELVSMLTEFMQADLYIQRTMMTAVAATDDGEDIPEIELPDADEVISKKKKDNDDALIFFWASLQAAGLASKAQPGPLGNFGPSSPYSGGGDGNATLWKRLRGTILPADGQTLDELVKALTANNAFQVIKLVKQAYVNGSTKQELLDAIIGTKENGFSDGILNKQANQANTVQHTLMQQVTTNLSLNLQAKVYDCYQWVSVLDNRTSQICIGLNGQVFQYGRGPVPPAHYRCRSKIIPAPGCEGFTPPSAQEFFDTDTGDAANYGGMVDGKFKVKRVLNMQAYIGKINDILAD